MSSQPSGWSEVARGFRTAAATVVPSILAYGAVWGGLARQAGLSVGELLAMCLLVSAGTAQFVALPMITAGAPAGLLVVTTFIVNLRHYLMAASLAPHFARVPSGRLALLAHGVTDESYALAVADAGSRGAIGPAYFGGCALAAYLAWYLGALGGALLGGLVPEPRRYGLDFVFPAVFLAILARTVRAPWEWLVAAVATALAVAVVLLVGGSWHIAVAGLLASLLGLRLAPVPSREAASP